MKTSKRKSAVPTSAGHLSSSNFVSNEQRELELTTSLASARTSLSERRIADLDTNELVATMAMLQHGTVIGVWETPRRWAPGLGDALWRIDLRERTLAFLPDSMKALMDAPTERSLQAERLKRLVAAAVDTMTRYLLVCRTGPAGMKRGANEPLDPSYIARLAYTHLPMLASIGIERQFKNPSDADGSRLFANLKTEDLVGKEKYAGAPLATELKRLALLHAKGLWNDAPELSSVRKTTQVEGPAEVPKAELKRDPHRPLPDDYVSEMGRKAAWLIENLGPSVVAALQGLAGIWKDAAVANASSPQLTNACNSYLRTFEWRDAELSSLTGLPFPILLNHVGRGHAVNDPGPAVWPPRGAAQVFGLAKLLQAAHLFVLSLSFGARRTEVITLERTCVAYAKDGEHYANGRTFKLVKRHDGEERDWVLPDFAVQALEQQVRLIAAAERLSPGTDIRDPDSVKPGLHLWGAIGGGVTNRAEPLNGKQLNYALVTFAEALGMSTKPGGQTLRSHRFRKTLARLGALAIVEAPKVLLDVFGHKSLEMTLYYILEDKDLRAEIEEIARELRVMRATTVVDEMLAAEEADEAIRQASGETSRTTGAAMGGYGGLAAVSIHRAVVAERDQAHRRSETWGAENVHDLAVMLTAQGNSWQMVRPGVVCTKHVGQAGPCNRKKGHPEPARCQSLCDYRLEEAWHREDVDGTIADAVRLYVEAGERGEDLAQCLWKDQVLVNLPRFPDLHAKWMQHAVVRNIVESEGNAA